MADHPAAPDQPPGTAAGRGRPPAPAAPVQKGNANKDQSPAIAPAFDDIGIALNPSFVVQEFGRCVINKLRLKSDHFLHYIFDHLRFDGEKDPAFRQPRAFGIVNVRDPGAD
jgi:hypothetical protein